jgi:hypothetical protein
MSVDDLVPDSWDPHVQEALDRWRQGHLLRAEVGGWLAPAGQTDVVTLQAAGENATGAVAKRLQLSDTGYYVVVSQTCDIAATGPGRLHPFVQVCPVRDLRAAFEPEKVAEIRRGRHVSWTFLTRPPELGVDWAVDLRVSIPISKAFLVNSSPVPGFASEADELALAERIGVKAHRPALHEALSGLLVAELRTCVRKSKEGWRDEVEQLRLTIVDGTRLEPKRVRVVVVTDTKLSLADTRELRQLRKGMVKRLHREGIVLEPMRFREVDRIPIPEYRDAVPLSIPELERGEFL